MQDWFKKWWPWLKILIFLSILVAVGYYFWKILKAVPSEADRSPIQILWDEATKAHWTSILSSGMLYLVGMGFAATFWAWLMRILNQPMSLTTTLKGYYISQLGKYVPGKGLALVLRASYASDGGARPGIAVLAAIYETLTLMACGSMLAVILLPVLAKDQGKLIWSVLALLAVAGIPIIPGVFNQIVKRLGGKFLQGEEIPRLSTTNLLSGLGLTSVGWLVLGASFFMLWHGVYPETISFSLRDWMICVGVVAISYVAGFLALFTPGGLGVREILLQQLLQPRLGPKAVVLVLLLRLLWTVAEIVISGVLIWLPSSSLQPQQES